MRYFRYRPICGAVYLRGDKSVKKAEHSFCFRNELRAEIDRALDCSFKTFRRTEMFREGFEQYRPEKGMDGYSGVLCRGDEPCSFLPVKACSLECEGRVGIRLVLLRRDGVFGVTLVGFVRRRIKCPDFFQRRFWDDFMELGSPGFIGYRNDFRIGISQMFKKTFQK